MKEIEFQFIELDIDEFRDKLEDIGAEQVHEEIMYKSTYFYPSENKFIRIRLEGGSVSFTMKEIGEGFAEEMEFVSSNSGDDMTKLYDDTVKYYNSILKDSKAVVTEKKSEKWKYDEFTINLDTWPGLPTYVEVEGPSEEEIFELLREMEYKGTNVKYFKHGAFDYYQYKYKVDRDILKKTSLTFDTIDDFLWGHAKPEYTDE